MEIKLGECEKDTLATALYSYVSDTVDLYHNGNMQEFTADSILADVRQICLKNEIKDVVSEYYNNEIESRIDQENTRAENEMHNL